MLLLCLYFGYRVKGEISTVLQGGAFTATAACLQVVGRRGGSGAASAAIPAVSAFGLLRGSCPLPAAQASAAKGGAVSGGAGIGGIGNSSICVHFGDAVLADGYYFSTLNAAASEALDPVRQSPRVPSCSRLRDGLGLYAWGFIVLCTSSGS